MFKVLQYSERSVTEQGKLLNGCLENTVRFGSTSKKAH
jgi:hypothetical protein